MHEVDVAQYSLDFSSAEKDRFRRLNEVLRPIPGMTLQHWQLCFITHNFTRGPVGCVQSVEGWAKLLWCSPSTVRRVIRRLEELGVLTVDDRQRSDGGDDRCQYRMDWDAVDALAKARIAQRFGATPPVTMAAPPVTMTAPPCHRDSAYKEETSFGELKNGHGHEGRSPDRDELLQSIPELIDAASRIVAPRDPGGLVYGTFHGVEQDHLRNGMLIDWHQRQLSLPRPVCGPTEADLLLTLAAGLHVMALPANEIRKGRVACWANLVRRGWWRQVARSVPEAADRLNALAQGRGRGWLLETVQ